MRPRSVAIATLFAALRTLLLCALLVLPGCYGFGFFHDGSSVSFGTINRGALRHGRKLPPKGDGYIVPQLWAERGNQYGTDEIVGIVTRAARRVRHEYPGSLLGIADIAQRGGGDSKLHRSHENGRDADLIFYAVDDAGKPVMPVSAMPRYDAALCSHPPRNTEGVKFGPCSPRHFDVPRNWALVRALLQDPEVEVQYLFCNDALRREMLHHAARIGEDPALVERAEAILRQPGDSLPHDDHLHLRIYCPPDDRGQGCQDRGPLRWWKKRWKYMAGPRGWSVSAFELVRIAVGLAFPRVPGLVP